MHGPEIAIIGMAGRFPEAPDIRTLWNNLCAGKESIRAIGREELLKSNVPPATWDKAGYVPAVAMPEDIELFGSRLFGVSPAEADLIDPQQRLLLECAWNAMEDAAYDVSQGINRVGVFAGSALNTYLLLNLMANRQIVEGTDLSIGHKV